MTARSGAPSVFEEIVPLTLQTSFDGGKITSDGGLAWLTKADRELGLCEALANHVPEWRRRAGARHSLETLVRQRVYQIACGYEDQNDADTLREDPLLKLVCRRPRRRDPTSPAHPLPPGECGHRPRLLPDGEGARRTVHSAA